MLLVLTAGSSGRLLLLLFRNTMRIALLIPADERRNSTFGYVILLSQAVIALIGTEVFAGNGNLQGRIILTCIMLLFRYFHIYFNYTDFINCTCFLLLFYTPYCKAFSGRDTLWRVMK